VQIIGFGSPKGGVGKTTLAVTFATILARLLGFKVLLVDADRNRSAIDHAESAQGDAIPVEFVDGSDPAELASLRRIRDQYDVTVVDLPGARGEVLRALLLGEGGRPAVDLLVVPIEADLMSTRPTVRVVRSDVVPLGLDHLLVLNKVNSQAAGRISTYQGLLSASGLDVAETVVRHYAAYRDALESECTILDLGGAHSIARRAEEDCRALTVEILGRVGIDASALKEGRK
jgi:cellulose biosynthesis protein BcsQ